MFRLIELRTRLNVLWRWSWLSILAATVGGSLAYVSSRSQPLQYRASSVIEVARSPNPVNFQPGMNSFTQSAETDIALSKTWPVLEAVVKDSSLPFDVDTLAGLFQVEQIDNTSLLRITVTFTDPILTADIANSLAKALIALGVAILSQG
jgi:uncharacterized protein involved in exopolysaccharide biosynthesis